MGLYGAGGIGWLIVGAIYFVEIRMFFLGASLSSGEAAPKNLAGQVTIAQTTIGLAITFHLHNLGSCSYDRNSTLSADDRSLCLLTAARGRKTGLGMSKNPRLVLDSLEPDIRYKTHVQLLSEDPDSNKMLKLQEEIRSLPRVRSLLYKRKQDGSIPLASLCEMSGSS